MAWRQGLVAQLAKCRHGGVAPRGGRPPRGGNALLLDVAALRCEAVCQGCAGALGGGKFAALGPRCIVSGRRLSDSQREGGAKLCGVTPYRPESLATGKWA